MFGRELKNKKTEVNWVNDRVAVQWKYGSDFQSFPYGNMENMVSTWP